MTYEISRGEQFISVSFPQMNKVEQLLQIRMLQLTLLFPVLVYIYGQFYCAICRVYLYFVPWERSVKLHRVAHHPIFSPSSHICLHVLPQSN